MASTLCQIWLSKTPVFVVWTIRFCSNSTSIWYKHFLRNVWRDFRLPMSALATVARKSFMANLQQKLIFRSGILFYHCWRWHWKSKISPHIIWQVFGPHAGEIWTKSYGSNHTKFCVYGQKMVNNFWQSVERHFEDVSVTETIVWC